MDNDVSNVLSLLSLTEDHFIERGLPRYEDAPELIIAQTDEDGREHELTPLTCEAWQRMKQAAAEDGHDLFLVSAFRSVSRQAEIVRNKHLAGISNEEIFAVSAPPGFSEHHTGRAIDISTPGYPVLEEEFETSDAFAWLAENAESFGFSMTYPRGNRYGFLYEPWHWCFTESKITGMERV
ncbi:MAG: M15 family metallopeptidase [Akkermansiaceae bacterium]